MHRKLERAEGKSGICEAQLVIGPKQSAGGAGGKSVQLLGEI